MSPEAKIIAERACARRRGALRTRLLPTLTKGRAGKSAFDIWLALGGRVGPLTEAQTRAGLNELVELACVCKGDLGYAVSDWARMEALL